MKVKQYHPDVNRDERDSDTMIRRVIQAYEVILNQYYRFINLHNVGMLIIFGNIFQK